MAGVDYTTDSLVASIKRRITLPDAENLYQDEDLIAFASDELSSTIEPLVHSVQQEYWVTRLDVALVADQLNYTIPIRGIVNGLRLVTMVTPSGFELNFPLLRPENTAATSSWLSPYTLSVLYGFNLEDDHIVVFPKQIVANPVNSVRFRFERMPNQLVPTDEAAQITIIAGNVVTVGLVPTAWTTTDTFDIIKGQPNFISRGDDLTISALTTTTITFNALPSTVVVGDWIALAGQSPIAQIPYQLFPYLAQCAATLALAGLGDTQSLTDAKQTKALMKEDLLKMLQPRDMGNVQTVVNRDGLFDSGQFWGWSGGNYF